MNKPIYIAFEGIDGSGKSVQFNLLKDLLLRSGVDSAERGTGSP